MFHLHRIVGTFLVALVPALVSADSFFVAPNGIDEDARDGRPAETAWASLAYACERVPEGKHSIHIAPGQYVAVRTAHPKSGHLRTDHNWIHIEKPNGRVYTHHGGANNGPIWWRWYE